MTDSTLSPATSAALRRDSFIDGEWRPAGDGRRYPVHNPADGSVITEFAAATTEDCLAAVEAAARAWPEWAARAHRGTVRRSCVQRSTCCRPRPRSWPS